MRADFSLNKEIGHNPRLGNDMKKVREMAYPAFEGAERIYNLVSSFLGLIRDLVKTLYLVVIQVWTRLFYIEREPSSSISIWARLDIIPRSPKHERHRLRLGKKSLIEVSSIICTWHGDVIIEDGSHLGAGDIVIGPVIIGENSACGQHCFISGMSHQYEDDSTNFLEQGHKIDEVVIGKNVWIGSNSVVLPGVKIGDNSVVAAGSTVVSNVPAYTVVAGEPACAIKKYDFQTKLWARV